MGQIGLNISTAIICAAASDLAAGQTAEAATLRNESMISGSQCWQNLKNHGIIIDTALIAATSPGKMRLNETGSFVKYTDNNLSSQEG